MRADYRTVRVVRSRTMSSTDRPYDIVVFGATGFMGQLAPQHVGVVTPAMAMGNALIGRLQAQGITFDVVEE